jgi:Ca-activated chloride channel family protein
MAEGFGFARPWLLLLLPLVAALYFVHRAATVERERALSGFAGYGAGLVSTSRSLRRVKELLLVFALAAATVAMAGPQIGVREREVTRRGVDVVLALDVSQSMAVRDVYPDRLRVARDAVAALSPELEGSRAALVFFGGDARLRYPLTTEPTILPQVLDTAGTRLRPRPGSSLSAGLDAAFRAFPSEVLDADRPKAILLISDGGDGSVDLAALTRMRDRNVHVFAIGIGTREGGQIPTYDTYGDFDDFILGRDGRPAVSYLQEDVLRAIAERTGGRYWQHTAGEGVVRDVVGALRAMDTSEITIGRIVPDDRFQIFLALAVGALLVEWFMSERTRMAYPGAPERPSQGRIASYAARLRSLWRRAAARALRARWAGLFLLVTVSTSACGSNVYVTNRAGNDLFARGDFEGALSRYRDVQLTHPELLQVHVNAGNARHELGDYVPALLDYDQALSATDRQLRATTSYNRGNTLFRMGRLLEARESYRQSLREDHTNRDAKFNLELIEEIIAQLGLRPAPGGDPSEQDPSRGGNDPSQSGAGQNPLDPGAPDQAPPENNRVPGTAPPRGLSDAVREFRRRLTMAEALRVLEALRGEQRGIEGLIEGDVRPDFTKEPLY